MDNIIMSVLREHDKLSTREIIFVVKKEKLLPHNHYSWGIRQLTALLKRLKFLGFVSVDLGYPSKWRLNN